MVGQCGGQYVCVVVDVEYFFFGMWFEGGEQQLVVDVQIVVVEDVWQGFNCQIIQCVFVLECVGVEGWLFFQMVMIEVIVVGVIYFV